MDKNNPNHLLFNNHSYFDIKINDLFTILYFISSSIKLPVIIHAILIFIEDLQLGYYLFNNVELVKIPEKIKYIYSFIIFDSMPYNVLKIIHSIFSIFTIYSFFMIVIYLFIRNMDKIKVDNNIKMIQIYVVLFDSILLFPFLNSTFKFIIIKDGKLAAFPEVSMSSNIILFIISSTSLLFFLILMLFNSYIFVAPTSLEKNNTRLQILFNIGLHYNFFKLLLILMKQLLEAYLPHYEYSINIVMFIGLVYLIYFTIKKQPYYCNTINALRTGLWSTLILISFIISILKIYNVKSNLISLFIVLAGIINFFIGMYYYKYLSRKHINTIYTKYKEHILFKKLYGKSKNSLIDSHTSSSNSSHHNSSDKNNSEENNDNSSDDEDNEKSQSSSGSSNSEEVKTESSQNSEDKNSSDSLLNGELNNKTLFIPLKEKIRIFNSLDNIVTTTEKKELIIPFKTPMDFELSCRFLRNNESKEAFNLISELFKECKEFYPANPYTYIYYAYFMAYIDKIIEKSCGKNNNSNTEISRNSIYDYLIKANSCKTNFFTKYYIRYIYLNIKNNYEDVEKYSKRNTQELFDKLQQLAIFDHITILKILKQFFNYVKHFETHDNEKIKKFNLNIHLKLLHKLKTKTSKAYQKLIYLFPEDNSSKQLYKMFLSNIMSGPESEEYITNKESKNKAKNNNKNAFSSLLDLDINDDFILQKERRNNLIHIYTDKSKRIYMMVIYIYSVELILYTIIVIFNVFHLYRYNHIVDEYSTLSDIDYYINNLLSEIKMMTLAIIDKDEEAVEEHLGYIENEYLVNFDSLYIPLLKEYSNMVVSSNPIISYGGDKSELIYLNGFELVKKIEYYGYEIAGTSYNEWVQKVENGENLLNNNMLRILSVNYPEHANRVLQETIDYIIELDSNANNKRRNIINYSVVVIVILTLYILIYGIRPILSYSKNMQKRTIRTFKCLMKKSLNEIIAKCNDDVTSIIETYDVEYSDISKMDKDNVYGKLQSILNFLNKVRGPFLIMIIIISVIAISLPVIIFDNSILNHLEYNFNVSERKDHILDIFMFSFETLLQDRNAYVPGEAEARLNQEIQLLEDLQEKIYLGKLGLKSTSKMDYLDQIFISHECFNVDMSFCEEIIENVDCDFTHEIVKLSVDELINEYIEKARSILYQSNVEYNIYNEDSYNEIITPENIKEYRSKYLDNNDYQFQYEIFDYIIGALKKYESIIYDILYNKIKDGIICVILFYLIGTSLIVFSISYTYHLIKDIYVDLKELVNIIFIIPKADVEASVQFKRLVENGYLEY